jgi:hypothetical protein
MISPWYHTKRADNTKRKNGVEFRMALNDLPGSVEQVIQHVAALQVTVTPNAAAAPGLTDQAAARRERRMQKTQW